MTGLKEAMFYVKRQNGSTHCFLCPHHCTIPPERIGFCGVRKNIDGILYTLNYEHVSSLALDPIEKKPLVMFHPGSYILSVGSTGCNFQCTFCQNYQIARAKPDGIETIVIKSEDLVKKAVEIKSLGNIGLAYTYNEPTIWYEYVYETAKLAKAEGLVNVLVTNGYISRKPLEKILPYIDAMNIDLKAFKDEFYRNIVKGNLENIKESVKISAQMCHVEITTLVIPGLNDSNEEIEELSKWLSSISPDIPLHLSRFFPRYQMKDIPPTPIATLTELKGIARQHLNNVYIGNV